MLMSPKSEDQRSNLSQTQSHMLPQFRMGHRPVPEAKLEDLAEDEETQERPLENKEVNESLSHSSTMNGITPQEASVSKDLEKYKPKHMPQNLNHLKSKFNKHLPTITTTGG